MKKRVCNMCTLSRLERNMCFALTTKHSMETIKGLICGEELLRGFGGFTYVRICNRNYWIRYAWQKQNLKVHG